MWHIASQVQELKVCFHMVWMCVQFNECWATLNFSHTKYYSFWNIIPFSLLWTLLFSGTWCHVISWMGTTNVSLKGWAFVNMVMYLHTL
jgi:hypothetical protein